MIAYAFLGKDRTELFSARRWPADGEWLETVTAFVGTQLLPRLDLELWEVELDEPVRELDDCVRSERGRIVAQVGTWDEDGARALTANIVERARANADEALRREGLHREADSLVGLEGLPYAEAVALVESVASPVAIDAAFFAADAEALSKGRRPEEYGADPLPEVPSAAIAANVGFVVAHAVAMAAPSGYDAAFAAERRRQLGVLEHRLGRSLEVRVDTPGES